MKQLPIFFFLCFLFSSSLIAQNMDYRHVFSVNAGQSALGIASNAAENFVQTRLEIDTSIISVGAIEFDRSLVYEGTYDFGVKKWLSFGVVVANQNFSVAYTDFSFINDVQDIITIDGFTGNMNRLNATLRTNFHYGNHDRLDMYSGLRLGVSVFTFSTDSDIPYTNFAKFGGPLPSLGATIFGIRYYFTENIGAGAEVNVGAPYIYKIGVTARF